VTELIGWLDCSAGVAGDMLLGALVDAGVASAEIQAAVDAVLPGAVAISAAQVTRAGMRATKADVRPLVVDPPHRTWADIDAMLRQSDLAADVRERALAVFDRLAEAEARVHGIDARAVHFHEVGALDSIADVVGVCAGVTALGLSRIVTGPIALGSGSTGSAHGRLAVPVPAVLELSAGWLVTAGGDGELTTPTGMALVSVLAQSTGQLPEMTVDRVGIGAGSRDTPGRANVTRLVVGTARATSQQMTPTAAETMIVLESNVDDLDPRLWPGVLGALLTAGAADAWLTPILAKKGRPAHILSVLAAPERAIAAREVVLTRTSSLGMRSYEIQRFALPRRMIDVALERGQIGVKIGHRDGIVMQVTPEFEDVAAYAVEHGRAEHEVMAEALATAGALGFRAGSALPD
jgi:pyridinium-3,5-bisthiocarboxylic acid mononucleotide nickel chelatase